MSEMMYVLAASYDDVDTALAEYTALEAAYKHVGTSLDFDATVVAREPDGKVKIVERHDAHEKEGTSVGLGWGPRPARSRRCSPRSGSSAHSRSAVAPAR